MKHQNFLSPLETTLKGLVCLFAGLFLLLFWENSLFYTATMTDLENARILGDSPLPHFALLTAVLGAGVLCRRLKLHLPRWTGYAAVGCSALFLLWFVRGTQLIPENDQVEVLDCARQYLQGDYSAFEPGNYLSYNSNQIGLLAVLIPFVAFFGDNADVAAQYLNVPLFAVSVLALGGAAKRWFGRRFLLPIAFFLPMGLYVTFVYGTMPGLAAACIALYALARWQQTPHAVWGVVMAVCLAFACMVKGNYLIILIAVCLFLAWDALSRMDFKPLAVLLLCIILTVAAQKAANWAVCTRVGITAPPGIQSLGWVAMGIEDADTKSGMPGWWNARNSNFTAMTAEELPAVKTAAKENIAQSLRYWAAHPTEALHFFARKNASQWAFADFESLSINRNRYTALGDSISALALGLLGQGRRLQNLYLTFCNLAQSLIYAGALLWLLLCLPKLRLPQLVLPVAFAGGALFHTAWEAKAQYTLPYVFLLIPLAADGLFAASAALDHALQAKTVSHPRRLCCAAALAVVVVGLHGLHFVQSPTQTAEANADFAAANQPTTPVLPDGGYYITCSDGALVLTPNEDGSMSPLLSENEPLGFTVHFPLCNALFHTERAVIYADFGGIQTLAVTADTPAVLESRNWKSITSDTSQYWLLQPAEGGWLLLQTRSEWDTPLALTRQNGEISLQEITGDENQLWQITAVG